MALSLSASCARKFRTIPGFPLESKVVTRTFQPAAICVADLFKLTHYLLTAGPAKSQIRLGPAALERRTPWQHSRAARGADRPRNRPWFQVPGRVRLPYT